jgi:hypothetical protein
MGLHIDGVYVEPLRFSSVIEIGTFTLLIFHLIVSFCVLGYFIARRKTISKLSMQIHIFSLIGSSIGWQSNQVFYLYADVGILSHWLHGFWASIVMLLLFLIQLNIIKGFTSQTSHWLPKIFGHMHWIMMCWWLLTIGSYFAMIPTLGLPFTSIIELWFRLGYPLFLITVILYDTGQSIYIIIQIRRLFKLRASLMTDNSIWTNQSVQGVMPEPVSDKSPIIIKGLKRMTILVSLAIFIDWAAVATTVYSLQFSDHITSTLLNVIGGSIAFIHIDLVPFIFLAVKNIKVTQKDAPMIPITLARVEVTPSVLQD